MFKKMSIDIEGLQCEIEYCLYSNVVCAKISFIGSFTTWIDIPIKKIFNSNKYILKNIKKHSTLDEIFEKLDEKEILEITNKIKNIVIESQKAFSLKYDKNKIDIANLKIKK